MVSAYDNFDYPSYWKNREYEHNSEVIAIKNFLDKIPKINSIADIGCGYGRLTPYYIHRTKKIVLIDPSKSLLKQLKKNLQTNPPQDIHKKNIKIIQSKVENLPRKIKKRSIDLAIMVRVIHHLMSYDQTISMVNAILKDGGYLILEFPNKLHIKAIGKNFLKGNLTFPIDISPTDRRSPKNIKKNTLPFLNFHPDKIEEILKKNHFKIIEKRSVSNIRSEHAKKNFSVSFLLWLENLLQIPFGKINFGPSIFILARKRDS